MANCDVHVGDSLTVTLSLVKCDGSIQSVLGASVQQIILKGPTTRLVKTSTFVTDGSDGQIQALVDAGEIDETGTWKVQGTVTIPDSPDLVYNSEIKEFPVVENI